MSNSEWLKDYYSRIIEEYKFSMERKDRVTDWTIGIFFVSLVAYAELLREQTPSIWRVALLVGVLCFIVRLFFNSCLAYGYLKKWRYLLDLIEKHWMDAAPALDFVKNEIKKFHYTPRTTEGRIYFVKSQLLAGFLLLFFFPFFLLLFEIYSNPQDLNAAIPISFLVAYYVYESVAFSKYEALSTPKDGDLTRSKEGKTSGNTERLDRTFDIFLLLQTLIFGTVFQYLAWISETKELMNLVRITRILFIPLLIIIILWIFSRLIESPKTYVFIQTIAWHWSAFSFLIQMLFAGLILYGEFTSPQLTNFFLSLLFLLTIISTSLGWMVERVYKKSYADFYSRKFSIICAVVSLFSMMLFFLLVYIGWV